MGAHGNRWLGRGTSDERASVCASLQTAILDGREGAHEPTFGATSLIKLYSLALFSRIRTHTHTSAMSTSVVGSSSVGDMVQVHRRGRRGALAEISRALMTP